MCRSARRGQALRTIPLRGLRHLRCAPPGSSENSELAVSGVQRDLGIPDFGELRVRENSRSSHTGQNSRLGG
eukprot:15463230-Alexandrium_andersonii.AAC.1